MHIAVDALLLKNQNAGTGLYTHHLLVALSKQRSPHRFTVFVNAAYRNSGEFESEHITLVKIRLPNTALRIAWEQFILPKQLQRFKVDIALYPFFIKPVLSHVPAAVVIHDVLIKAYPELIGVSRRWYLDAMIRHAVQHAQCVITVSEYAKADIVRHYGIAPQRISVVPAAAAPQFDIKVSDKERQQLLRTYAVPFERFFLSVGVRHRYKNYLELLRAFKAASEIDPTLRLVLVGSEGDDAKNIHRFIEQSALQEKVFCANYVASDDLRAFYASAVALVMSSQYESFGMPIVEAMKMGCLVIVANRAAMPETAGKAALIYDNGDELQQLLLEVWRNPVQYAELIEKGRMRAAAYSWEKSAAKLLAVLNACIQTR